MVLKNGVLLLRDKSLCKLQQRYVQKTVCHFSTESSKWAATVRMAFNLYETPETNKAAPPVIIMHGLLGSKQNWRGIARAMEFKMKRRIYAVDARNHGDSPHTEEHGSQHMAHDLKAFLRQHRIAKACMMGHSMGGRAVMYCALRYPELVERAIIVDISPVSVPRTFSSVDGIFLAMQGVSIPTTMSLAHGRALAEKQIKDVVADKGTVDFILMNLQKHENGEFYWKVNTHALRSNLRQFSNFMDQIEGLKPYPGPTIFICGSQSNFVIPEQWPAIQSIFPKAELKWLDSGHLVHFEKPNEFLDIVVNFIEQKL